MFEDFENQTAILRRTEDVATTADDRLQAEPGVPLETLCHDEASGLHFPGLSHLRTVNESGGKRKGNFGESTSLFSV